eukprot:TRINITY_DN44042_c1_g1_i1.p1 TRINITY_DN44042_c1_g1~~TRINITY_DN44042_c1_g1_i1.p1  ORF type:complete len:456 (+),score=95.99 TRINITY_DN44042_c1_g1_i1:172-1539(+)
MGDGEDDGGTRVITVKVCSADGHPDLDLRVTEGSDYSEVVNEYCTERQCPVDSVTLAYKDGSVPSGVVVVAKPRRTITATIHGMAGLRSLVEMYDGTGRGISPNLRFEKHTDIRRIIFGTKMMLIPWNSSPYPRYLAPFLQENDGVLYVCDVCLRYAPVKQWMEEHIRETGGCAQGTHPPGRRIFTSRDKQICVWEVDGGIPSECILKAKGIPSEHVSGFPSLRETTRSEIFAQNAGLLARCFLKGKIAFYCPGAFFYYCITEFSEGAHRFRGFFSAGKFHREDSLSCIMVLPPWQDKGYGRLLIHLSYLLCKGDGQELPEQSPERPLSDLGIMAFLSYWKGAALDAVHEMLSDRTWRQVQKRKGGRDVEHVSLVTGICKRDMIKALHVLGLLAKPGRMDSEINWDAAANVKPVRRSELQLMKGSTTSFEPDPPHQMCSVLRATHEPSEKRQRTS